MSKGNLSKIDNLGRVVIPKSIRKALNIEHNDEISLHVEGESLVIKKGYRACSLCAVSYTHLTLPTNREV